MIIKPKIKDATAARRKSYPDIGDQLDAIMKGFAHLRENGVALPPDVEAWIGQCQEIKKRFPKPQ